MFNKENKKTMAVDNSVAGSNRIVAGTKIKGEVNSGSDFRIDGEIEGTIQTSGRLVVGRTGLIKGNVVCTTAVIEGEVQADNLAIEPGAVFNVTCKMGAKGAPVSNGPAKK